MYPPQLGYYRPVSLSDALDFLSNGDVKPLAGGQSLIPMLKFRILKPKFLLDLNPLKELNHISVGEDSVIIGATVTHDSLVKSGTVRIDLPLLHQSAKKVGDMQVRNMGTIGGSLANADPSADYPAVVTAYNAKLRLQSSKGVREVEAKDFFKGPYTTELREDELLVEIVFPKLKGYNYKYAKVVRRAGDFALVGMAVLAKVDGVMKDIRIAYTGVSDKPFRPYELEKSLLDTKPSENVIRDFAEKVASQVNTPSDSRGSSEYRKKVMKALTVNTLKEVLGVVS
ncbi:glyceraldehyde dehydrogenase subunit beta [Stygiolobus azoricus]|uniref:Xanthine dehydrogenase family protein subunit M n=1 Tax=Stygiolobus azoricus TaxID=41675 RepID=A0A650CRQ2_9CREN|nr:glyceraldehyde dehydrogenase subunit beta [Stygiolobus azoricus]QGR20425.1 xanthine dehydrogenase family protein subunit M [Stygiolobus azoricus]